MICGRPAKSEFAAAAAKFDPVQIRHRRSPFFMLPLFVSSHSQSPRFSFSGHARRRVQAPALLWLLLLLGLFVLFTLMNSVSFSLASHSRLFDVRREDVKNTWWPSALQRGAAGQTTTQPTIVADERLRDMRTLVMVAGHAVLKVEALTKQVKERATVTQRDFANLTLSKNDAWALEPHQAKYNDQAVSMLRHIRAGTTVARNDPNALLLFSGGATRANAGPLSEASSYIIASMLLGLLSPYKSEKRVQSLRAVVKAEARFGSTSEEERRYRAYEARAAGRAQREGYEATDDISWRALDESFARDSYENFVFSLCRFRELTGKYPEEVVVVGYEFKRRRFVDLHRAATGYPPFQMHYVGLPAPDEIAAAEGEALVVKALKESGGYGCDGPSAQLQAKRARRDPFHHGVGDYGSGGCPEMRDLIGFCGGMTAKSVLEKMPWAARTQKESADIV